MGRESMWRYPGRLILRDACRRKRDDKFLKDEGRDVFHFVAAPLTSAGWLACFFVPV
jgi:hypothetical protein